MHLETLRALLPEEKDERLFPCIIDLADHGLVLERFTVEDNIPSRQDITQFMAAWFKYIGLSSDECLEWMIEYCTFVLSAISSSSESQIRHSTKCNIRYVYRSDFTFNCLCEKNRFKAACESNCPIYDEMSQRANRPEPQLIVESYNERNNNRVDVNEETAPQRRSIKDEYKEQFDKAIEVVQHQLKQNTPKKEIVELLNSMGFKTRTGKKWTYSILGIELKNLNRNISENKGEKTSNDAL